MSTSTRGVVQDMEYEELKFTVREPAAAGDGHPRMVAFIGASTTGSPLCWERAMRLAQVDFPGTHFEVVDEFTEEDRRVCQFTVWEFDPEDSLALANA